MSIEKEKEMFEAWYEKHHNGRQISCDYVREENSYSIGYANAMWISWQASANRQGYKLVPVEPTQDMVDRAVCDTPETPSQDYWHYSQPISDDQAIACYKAMIEEETK